MIIHFDYQGRMICELRVRLSDSGKEAILYQ